MTIIDDELVEGTESFTLELRFDPLAVLPTPNIQFSQNVSIVTIMDNDDTGMM